MKIGKGIQSRQEKKGMTEVLDGITHSMDEFEQALWVGDGQGSLRCCSAWAHKVSDTTDQLVLQFLTEEKRHKIEGIQIVKEERKLSSFADDMIMLIGNPEELT